MATHDDTSESADVAKRLRWLLWVLTAAMTCGFLLSPKLWLSSRSYPLAPVWDGLPAIPPPWDGLWFGSLFVLLAASTAMRRPSIAILAFVALAALLSLFDQMRWQPWFYQYLCMLAVLSFALQSSDDPERLQSGFDACKLIVASIYIWSGMQKLNVSFVTNVHPWMIEPLLKLLPATWHDVVKDAGWGVAFVETGIGLGLLAGPLRYPAAIGALGMHAFILGVLGPWAHDWNSIVWPWNVAMMLMVVILFWRRPSTSWRMFWPRHLPIAWATLVLFAVMPAFSFLSGWDAYLSASLYSGNTLDARIYIDKSVRDALPAAVQKSYARMSVGIDDSLPVYQVHIDEWAMEELNIPGYPARRVYRSFALSLARQGGGTGEVVLIIEERPDWKTGDRVSTRETLKPAQK